MYLSKLEAQLVTSTLSENILWGDSGEQSQNFDFGISQTLILYARSIFSKGSHLLEILRWKLFFMKTLSKLGDLTVYPYLSLNPEPPHQWWHIVLKTFKQFYRHILGCYIKVDSALSASQQRALQLRVWRRFRFRREKRNQSENLVVLGSKKMYIFVFFALMWTSKNMKQKRTGYKQNKAKQSKRNEKEPKNC